MAKNSKKSKEETAAGSDPHPSINATRNGNGIAISPKPAAAKPSSAKEVRSPASVKPKVRRGSTAAAGAKQRKTAAPKKSGAGEGVISDDAVRLRAYFISEWRMKNGITGDSAHDWLEARRQLQEEAGQRA